MYWVTQGIITVEDLQVFQQAVRNYDGNIKKFYVTSRSISPSYTFEDDRANSVLATITPDEILSDDYVKAIEEAGLGEYLNPEREETDPNTTPIGEIDYFFHRPEAEEYEAIYYNPDAVAGGQFVILHLPYDLIAEAKGKTETAEEFFDFLDGHAYTELIDLGTPEYAEMLIEYADPTPDFIGRSEETMLALTERSGREIPEQVEAPVVPKWEQTKKDKVRGFDLHPDIPMSERHTFDLKVNPVETVGKKERFRRNIMAIQLLKNVRKKTALQHRTNRLFCRSMSDGAVFPKRLTRTTPLGVQSIWR